MGRASSVVPPGSFPHEHLIEIWRLDRGEDLVEIGRVVQLLHQQSLESLTCNSILTYISLAFVL